MSICRDCAFCIEYHSGDVRCSYGYKKGSLSSRELDEEKDCKNFAKRRRKKLPPSEIKIAEVSRSYKGDKEAMKHQTSLF